MNTCKKCLYTTNHPFGLCLKSKVCSGCITHLEKYQLNWQEREQIFLEKIQLAIEKNKSTYDCVIPYSGDAEDYHTVKLILDIGLRPLMVSVNDYFMNDIGWHNAHNLITHFDLDSLVYNPEIYTYKELVRTSLRKYNHPLWPSLALKSSFPVHIANQKKIPLIIYGQNQAIEQVGKFSHLDEVQATAWSRIEHDIIGLDIEDFSGSGGHIPFDDHPYYHYPPINELGKKKLVGLYLSNYFAWDPLLQNSKTIEYGFIPQAQSATFDPYERAGNSIYYNLHDLSKLIRNGYRKISDHVAREIRHSRLTTTEGKEIVNYYSTKQVYIKDFFEWLGVSNSGYEWYLYNKLGNVNHLISDAKVQVTSQDGKLPSGLKKLLMPAKLPYKEYSFFLKGISL